MRRETPPLRPGIDNRSGKTEAPDHRSVILSEQSESKDLRTDLTANVTASAKILRLPPVAQDDNRGRLAKIAENAVPFIIQVLCQ